MRGSKQGWRQTGLQGQTPTGLWALHQRVPKAKLIHSSSGLATTCYLLHHQAHYFCQRYFKNSSVRLYSLGIMAVMLTCIFWANLHMPFTWPALPLRKVVSSPRWPVGEGLHQKGDVLSDYERFMNALKLCFGCC